MRSRTSGVPSNRDSLDDDDDDDEKKELKRRPREMVTKNIRTKLQWIDNERRSERANERKRYDLGKWLRRIFERNSNG